MPCSFAAAIVAINRNDVMYGQPQDTMAFSCGIPVSPVRHTENINDDND